MDISSDSSDTIILNNDFNEPTDTEESVKKYSTSSIVESKQTTSFEKKFYDLDFSDEELIDVPLAKRVCKNEDENLTSRSTKQQNDINHKTDSFTGYGNDLLKELHSKYSSSSFDQIKYAPKSDIIVLSDSSDTESINTCSETLHKPQTVVSVMTTRQTVEEESNNARQSFEDDEYLEQLSPKTAGKLKRQRDMEKRKREREKKREEMERKKALKNLEKEKKKEATEQQKALKKAVSDIERSTKPDECIKYMTVDIDGEILEKEYGLVLKAVLTNNDISFKSTSQIIPKLISWRRKLQTIENMLVKDTEFNEKHFLLVMDADEFSNLARNNSLTLHIQEIMGLTQAKQLSLAIFGVDRAKGEEDFAVIEAQLFTKCYFRFLKKSEDFAAFVTELTKSVAQIPYKLKKEQQYMLQSEYYNDVNKDTVKVDKNGNGLGRLWHQMLTMFPLARLETAEAITAVYPTPASLFKAYESSTRKEELIQELPIRRAIGPCASVRRIGPELSKKCCKFFCSTEDVFL